MIFKINKLIIENWMGGTMEVELTDETDIFGANRAGKSRLKSAYHWILTDKNAADEANFEIKDTTNPKMHRLPHRVELHGTKNGEPLTLEKVYLEVWGTDKGEPTERLKGHTTKHFYNGSLKSAGEYKELLNAVIPEKMLKMLSDPLFFPEILKWEQQRQVLEKMANVTNESALEALATPGNDFAAVINILNKNQSLKERKERIAYEIRIAKDEKDTIRPGIKQNEITIESFGAIDPVAVNAEIERLKVKESEIDSAIQNKVNAEDLQNETARGKRNELNTLKNRQQEINQAHTSKYNSEKIAAQGNKSELENAIIGLSNQKRSKETLIENLGKTKGEIETSLRALVNEYNEEGKKVMQPIDESKFKCEHCNAPFDITKVEEEKSRIKTVFSTNKKQRLADMTTRGESLDKQLKETEALIKTETANLEAIKTSLQVEDGKLKELNEKIANQAEIQTVAERLAADPEYTANVTKISSMETELAENKPVDYSELRTEKQGFTDLIDAEKRKLNNLETIKNLQARNVKLAEREKTLAQDIATLQREESEINKFVIGRMELIEKAVRSNFKHVTFKMFETNIGNGEEKPFCEAWFEGKPFSALNTEAKLNAGLDILNGLSNHYKIHVPILIDNRESISEILPVNSQVINFFVDSEAKTLKVVNK